MAVWRARSLPGVVGRIVARCIMGDGLPWTAVLVSAAGVGWAAGRVCCLSQRQLVSGLPWVWDLCIDKG